MTIKELCERVWAGRSTLLADTLELHDLFVAVSHPDFLALDAEWRRTFGEPSPYSVQIQDGGTTTHTVFGLPLVEDTRLARGEIRFQWERSL